MSKKKRQLGNRFDEYTEPKVETFGTRQYDDDIFDLLEEEAISVTSDEIPIASIFADPLQPRRILPSEVRDDWDGDPQRMPDLLQQWAELLYDSGNDLPINKILKGEDEPSQYMTGEKFVDSFIALLNLASQIRAVGLNQRIGIRPRNTGETFQIIFGERRWTAFHMLDHWLPAEDFSSIPAKIADVSPWQVVAMQIGENNQREDTNAISKAREFARLLITARSETDNYDPPHTLNAPDCDRPWYAQVANGEVHRIPRGMGAQFEQVLAISTNQMRRYRHLLKPTEDYEINNFIWNIADDNDWTEGFMRDIRDHLELETIQKIIYTVPIGTVSQIEEALKEAIEAAKKGAALAKKQKQRDEQPYLNCWLEFSSGLIGQVTKYFGTNLLVDAQNGESYFYNTSLIIDVDVSPPTEIPEPLMGKTIYVDNKAYEVYEFSSNGMIQARGVESGVGHTFQHHEISLSPPELEAASPSPSESESNTIGSASPQEPDSQSHFGKPENDISQRLASELRKHLDDEAPSTDENLGVDNEHSQLLEAAAQLVATPMTFDGEPCIVIETVKHNPGHVVIQVGNERKSVHMSVLGPSAIEQDETLVDYMGKSEEAVITNIDSLPKKADRFLQGKDAAFIQTIIIAATAQGLPTDKLIDLHRLSSTGIQSLADEGKLSLYLSYVQAQVEAFTQHIDEIYAFLERDILEHFKGDTDG